MTKYVLAKDLPFARCGKEISLLYTGSKTVVECYLNVNDDVTFKISGEQMIENLIENGWIKEVKPREFDLMVSKLNGHIYDAAIAHLADRDALEHIKVREVLE